MTTWVNASTGVNKAANFLPLFANTDVVSSATPLVYLKNADPSVLTDVPLSSAFIGTIGGCLGETSAILLIIGGLYLLYKKVITWHIPAAYLGTVAVITFLFPHMEGISRLQFTAYNLFSGGLMLGAIFMATDYATKPRDAERENHFRRRLRSADRVYPLFRRLSGRRILCHTAYEFSDLVYRQTHNPHKVRRREQICKKSSKRQMNELIRLSLTLCLIAGITAALVALCKRSYGSGNLKAQ